MTARFGLSKGVSQSPPHLHGLLPSRSLVLRSSSLINAIHCFGAEKDDVSRNIIVKIFFY